MKRLVLVLVIGAACVLGQPQPASAGFWDWLEEYSGPGPFTGTTFLTTECWKNGKRPVLSPLGSTGIPATDPIPVLRCLYTDVSRFHAEADDVQGYPELSVWMIDFGGSLRISDGFDVGAGFGWVQYSGDTVPGARMFATPIRIVARPIVIGTPRGSRRDWHGFLSVYWKQTYIPGDYTGTDFGQVPPPGVTMFSNKGGELLGSFGMAFDATSLLTLLR